MQRGFAKNSWIYNPLLVAELRDYIVEEIYGQTHGIWMSQSAELQLLVTRNDFSL